MKIIRLGVFLLMLLFAHPYLKANSAIHPPFQQSTITNFKNGLSKPIEPIIPSKKIKKGRKNIDTIQKNSKYGWQNILLTIGLGLMVLSMLFRLIAGSIIRFYTTFSIAMPPIVHILQLIARISIVVGVLVFATATVAAIVCYKKRSPKQHLYLVGAFSVYTIFLLPIVVQSLTGMLLYAVPFTFFVPLTSFLLGLALIGLFLIFYKKAKKALEEKRIDF